MAINLIPFLAILISLYRVAVSNRNPAESLKLLASGLWILIPVAVAIGGGLILIVSLNLKKSLDAMVVVLKQVTSGKFGSRVKVTSNDEIGYVGDVINEMTEGLIERDRMRQSLDLAMEVQQNLLPKGNLRMDGFDIAGRSIYCDETGGDYYDFFTIDETKNKKIGVAIGDVSGHGIPSALLMATVRSSLRQRLSLPGSTAQIVSDVNYQLVRDVEDSGQFMTLFYLTVDPANQSLQWVRAGHDPGIFYDPATDTFEDLKGNGIALGVDADWQYEMNEKMGLVKGQIIVLTTDGVWEAHNRVQAALQAFVDNSISKTINFPSSAEPEDVAQAYKLAWELGCKGITVYVTGSRDKVVLETKTSVDEPVLLDAQIQIQKWQATKKPRPRHLEGYTYSIQTPLGKTFVTINENGDQQPFEVFINTAKAGSDTAAVSEAIGRSLSYILRMSSPIPPRQRLEEMFHQYAGIGGRRPLGFGPNRVRSLPDGIAQALQEYLEKPGLEFQKDSLEGIEVEINQPESWMEVGDLCPECGQAALVNEEGCRKCYSCGYSEC